MMRAMLRSAYEIAHQHDLDNEWEEWLNAVVDGCAHLRYSAAVMFKEYEWLKERFPPTIFTSIEAPWTPMTEETLVDRYGRWVPFADYENRRAGLSHGLGTRLLAMQHPSDTVDGRRVLDLDTTIAPDPLSRVSEY